MFPRHDAGGVHQARRAPHAAQPWSFRPAVQCRTMPSVVTARCRLRRRRDPANQDPSCLRCLVGALSTRSRNRSRGSSTACRISSCRRSCSARLCTTRCGGRNLPVVATQWPTSRMTATADACPICVATADARPIGVPTSPSCCSPPGTGGPR